VLPAKACTPPKEIEPMDCTTSTQPHPVLEICGLCRNGQAVLVAYLRNERFTACPSCAVAVLANLFAQSYGNFLENSLCAAFSRIDLDFYIERTRTQ
jgi:hypothetical protein